MNSSNDLVHAVRVRASTASLFGRIPAQRSGWRSPTSGARRRAQRALRSIRVAAEAACALTRVAFEIENVDRVEIHCAPENKASAAIPARLGFAFEGTLKRRAKDSEGGIRDLMMWSLFAADYLGSAPSKVSFRAFDCMGRVISVDN